jgi:hypothetical protein
MTFRRLYHVCSIVITMATMGCAALLPNSQSTGTSKWETYDAANTSFSTIEPYTTTKQDLAGLGLDPTNNANITILNYSDIIRRFIPSSAIASENLDKGIVDCIEAKNACSAYEIDVKSLKRKRSGNFWLDSLNFKRRTETSGWRFTGLVVLRDDLVVYKLSGGQPKIQEAEESRNPLGPFQGFTESVAKQVVR